MNKCQHKDCIYRDTYIDCCDYLGVTGHKRPCSAGECEGAYKKNAGERHFRFDTDKALELYLQGKNAGEIAAALGVSSVTVHNWANYEMLSFSGRGGSILW